MLRDYKLSLTLIALVLLGYTAMVIFSKHPGAETRPSANVVKASMSSSTSAEAATAAASAAKTAIEEVSTATSNANN